MNLFPDSNWINAFKLPTQVMIGLFIACSILLVLNYADLLKLNQFGKLAHPILIVFTIFTGSLSLTGIISFIKDLMSQKIKKTLLAQHRELKIEDSESKRKEAEKRILERLDHLSPKEVYYLADCLREGSQSFYAYVHSPPIATLRGKELVYTPGGTHHEDHYPYTIRDFVWKALLERKDEFIEKSDVYIRENME